PDAGPRPDVRDPGVQRLHAARRQARPGRTHRVERLHRPPRRPRHHVLPAASTCLGPAAIRWPARPGRAGGPPRRLRSRVRRARRRTGCCPHLAGPRPGRVTDLAAVVAELLPGATWLGATRLGAAAGAGTAPARPIAWVRVLR